MGKIQDKLESMGMYLPECPAPVAAYLPVQRVGKVIYCSGQTASINGKWIYPGKVGDTVTIEQAYESAKWSVINCLSAMATIVDLDRIRIIRVTGYVNAAPDFRDQPKVINGASELLEKLYGENGRHARSAIGVGSLPSNASVEVEVIAEVLE